ncbi:hypothetical protein [Nostoc sp.]
MNKAHRLTGIDLLKGIAAYGVVFIHSTSGEFGSPSYWTIQLGDFFQGFCQINSKKTILLKA